MGADAVKDWAHPGIRPRRNGASRRTPSGFQITTLILLALTSVVALIRWPETAFDVALVLFQAAFVVCALWKAVIGIASLRRPAPVPRPIEWPRYTILAALYDEAAVASQLISNLSRIDYPAHRLEAFIVLEAHDEATKRKKR